MFKKIKSFFKGVSSKAKSAYENTEAVIRAKVIRLVAGTRAEAYVDTGVKILIAVVVGALVLTLIYGLFNTVIMPTVETRVESLFNYAG